MNSQVEEGMEDMQKYSTEIAIVLETDNTLYTLIYIIVKPKCKANMTNEVCDLMVYISRLTRSVRKAYCSCSAGNNGYCNDVVPLFFKLAECSLNLLENIPEEISCTSRLREWGIPSYKTKTTKNPIIFTNIHKFEFKHDIEPTLDDPRRTKYKEEDLKRNICN